MNHQQPSPQGLVSKLAGSKAVRIVLIVVMALAAMGAMGSVLADTQETSPALAKFTPEEIAEFNRILGTNGFDSTAVDNGCVQEVYIASGQGGLPNNCTANEVRLGTVTSVNITDDGCKFPGDTVTFDATFQIINGASSVRRDVGIYFSQDGDSAISGNCSIGNLSTSPFPKIDDDGDTCGDIAGSETGTEVITGIEVPCIDTSVPSDGLLDIPYCTTWQTPSENIVCNSPTQTTPGTPSKCDCPTNPITVPIEVPGIGMDIEKSPDNYVAKPGEQFTYTLVYTNLGNGAPPNPPTPDANATATNIVVTDQLPTQLKFVGVGTVPPGTSCSDNPVGGYGALVTCTGMPNLIEGASATIELIVMVNPNAVAPANPTNTACVEGTASGNPSAPAGEDCDTVSLTTPVTVAYFKATPTAGGTRFEWTTSTETANAGFNIYIKTAAGYEKVNDKIILTNVIDSSSPQDYVYEAAGVSGDTFYIEDVSLFGEVRSFGPFKLNEAHGLRVQPEAIDWAGIQAETQAIAAERSATRNAEAAALAAQAERAQTLTSRVLNLAGRIIGGAAENAAAYPSFELRVSQDGIYRLTYEQLKQQTGVDLNGLNAAQLSLKNRGQAVPLYVSSNKLGPGVYVEFYGQALDTLYTDTNVYVLAVDPAAAVSMPVVQARVPRKVQFPAYYVETTTIERNAKYSYVAPTGDPWFDTGMIANASTSWTFDVPVSDYVAGATTPQIAVKMWGGSNMVNGPDHRVLVAVNDQQVADELFDGTEIANVTAPVSNLVNGTNKLKLTLPVDRGAPWDLVALEQYAISYPRAFLATGNRLDFTAAAEAFDVGGLNSSDVVVYRLNGAQPERLSSFRVRREGSGYFASFLGGSDATYYVSTAGALLTPEVNVAAPAVDITSGTADLLVIAHEQFLAGFAPLVQARQAEGYTVKLVNVADVYAQYSGGVFDAQAIKDYIKHAVTQMGVDYIILGGGDTTDYRDYLGQNSFSHIPSLYAPTSETILFAPVDPLYTDVNGDGFPDAALGRFPARTTAELTALVNKTLVYNQNVNASTVVFAADNGFESDSESYLRELTRSKWQIDRAYIGAIGAPAARSALLTAINSNPRMASFVGHSSAYQWTTASSPLFNYKDAAAMTNTVPTMITQWGCWNTYYVDPSYSTLAHKFLLTGSSGAAAVAGSTTITLASSERALGDLMMPRMIQQGVTIGSAMQNAKAELALTQPELTDVILGWTILGDPTVKVNP